MLQKTGLFFDDSGRSPVLRYFAKTVFYVIPDYAASSYFHSAVQQFKCAGIRWFG
jgi:hypothetical protein